MEYVMMNESHVAHVAHLEKLCFHDPWSIRSIMSELNNPLSLWLVAMDGDTLAGYIGSQSVMGESDMMNVAVNPDYRKQGVGTKLIAVLVEALVQAGNHCLTLEVRASNSPAICLYEKLGFACVGRRPNYYRNPKEDALILKKML